MTAEKWHQVKEVFQAVLDLGPESKPSSLSQLCADDSEVRLEVESLLNHYHRQADTPMPVLNAEPGPQVPSAIGSYRLLRELGRGGMSIVYLARRDDEQYQKRVAVKVLRPGMASEDVIHRFRRERQILAALDHPNIARLHDGGTTADGLPYFVLEYVEGTNINHFCDQRRLTVDERLRLFQTVCSAVQHAHRNLIVHRDLKPGNILVTTHGTPKLLDFGIAKLLNPELSAELLHSTAVTTRLMTPGYASPEQVRGQTITTASDVYSLGVLLYELLTGRGPYAGKLGDAAAVEEAVCQVEPRRASSWTPSESVSEARGSSPRKLRRRLTGDLDAILAKALRKEPADRYSSVEQFSDDVGRHLGGFPVMAYGRTVLQGTVFEGIPRYRAGKFIRRHKTGVTAAVLVLAALLAGLVGTVWQASEAHRQRVSAQVERERADKVSSYLVELFRLSDPHEALANRIPAREILDRGARQITRLEGQPELQAALMHTMGRVYQNLGLYNPAAELLQEALEIRRESDNLESASTMSFLAQTRHMQGELTEAERLYRSCLDIRRRGLGPEHLDVAESLTELAELLHERGNYEAAEERFRKGLEIRLRHLGEEHPLVAESHHVLADLLVSVGDYDAAEQGYRQALEIRRRRLDPEHPEVASSLNGLATVLQLKGDFENAERLYRQSLEFRRKRLGEDHPAVAQSLANLGWLLYQRDDVDAAEPLHRRALAIRSQRFVEQSVVVAESVNHLANVLYSRRDYISAEVLFRQALELNRKLRGERHLSVAMNLHNLGLVLREQSRFEAAEASFRQALEIQAETLGDDSALRANTLSQLAVLHRRRGELKAAGSRFHEALAMGRKVLPGGHPRLALALVGLGQVLTEERRAEEARPLLEEGVAILAADRPAGDWRIEVARGLLGDCLAVLGRFAEAEPLLVDSYPIIREARGEQDLYTREARQRLERFRQDRGR